MAAASPAFVRTFGAVVNDLRAGHPDARVRSGLGSERLRLLGAPGPWDFAMAGAPPSGRHSDVLLGLHVGTPAMPPVQHEIRLYESGVVQAAHWRRRTVSDQIEETLLHELEHHYALCPDGHYDCTAEEIAATLAAGGTLAPGQPDWLRWR